VKTDDYSDKMAQQKQDIINTLSISEIVPVFYNADADVARAIVDACYAGGIRVFEFTNRGDNAFNVFAQLVKHVKSLAGAAVGIGTIIKIEDTKRFIDAGADFIVSPVIKEEMGEICIQHTTPWIPGCATLTEIVRGHEAGAPLIKLFPASVLGPQFVEAVKPVIPNIRLMPTGGVDTSEENLRRWFTAGVHCVGMGSQLLSKEIIENKDWKKLEGSVRDALAIVRRVKNKN
jgi:2-dehydro-3-deoxyphosphogluconate aldolase / (4S)-4-hydroxy-2-oxoglutarate aldolase